MKCEEVMESMQRYLDDDLHADECAAMREHMKTCASCAEMFERLTRLSEELVNLPKVEPPYSIVDSILPRLQEIDRHLSAERSPAPAEPPVVATAEPAVGHSPAERRRKRLFLYRIIGGAAAAVVFIGIAIQQLPQFVTRDSAESAPSAGAANSSASGGGPISVLMSAGSTASSSAESANSAVASESHVFNEELTAASRRDEPAADAPAPIRKEASDGQTVDFPTAEVASADDGGTDAQQREDRSQDLQERAIAGILGATNDQADGKREEGEMLGLLGVVFVEPMSTEAVPSPDNAFFAFTEYTEAGYQVVITDETGERIYVSPAKQADEIRNLEWSETGASLTYQVVAGEEIAAFTIEVKTRTERQIE
jgi:anti-sigma factor RsiW